MRVDGEVGVHGPLDRVAAAGRHVQVGVLGQAHEPLGPARHGCDHVEHGVERALGLAHEHGVEERRERRGVRCAGPAGDHDRVALAAVG